MPLSEHEQRLLEQLEQALSSEDPKFASAMRGSASRSRARRRILFGAVGVLIGLGLVLLGVARGAVIIGIAGFLVMVLGAGYAVTPERRRGPVGAVGPDGTPMARPGGKAGKPAKAAKSGRGGQPKRSFMARMEERWEHRRNNWDM